MTIKFQTFPKLENITLLAIFLAAIIMRLPGLESWWCLDDWGQLARAVGATDQLDSVPARWLSQHVYWGLAYPAFGINPIPYSISRILINALAAVTVARIAKNAGVGAIGCLLSALLFASSPISFSAIYWASGIQELLGGLFALLAVERWFVKGRTNVILAGIFSALSILSKESGLGLPFLFLGSVLWDWSKSDRVNRPAFASVLILFLVGFGESLLVLQHFATGLNDPYRMGGFLVVLGNLGKFGWWLLTQGPIFTAQVTWTMASTGIGFFTIWTLWAFYAIKQRVYFPIILLLAAVLSLVPALALVNQARPYMGYLAMACFALALGKLYPQKWDALETKKGSFLAIILFFISVAWGIGGMDHRIAKQGEDGLPSDPVVRAMALSQKAFHSFAEHLSLKHEDGSLVLVVFQQPLRAEDILKAKRSGDKSVVKSRTYSALDGEWGLALLTEEKDNVFWVNSLLNVPSGAYVFCETKSGFEFWGKTRDALLNATLIDVLIGSYDSAEEQLRRAIEIDANFESFEYDSHLLALPLPVLRTRAAVFLEKLVYTDSSGSSLISLDKVKVYESFIELLSELPK